MPPHDLRPSQPLAHPDAKLGYLLFRLTVGVNFLLHSFVRWRDLAKFVDGVAHDFAGTPLPEWCVRAFASVIPFWEPVIGLLLILGLFTRPALAAGAFLLVMLTLGTALRADYAALSAQLIYSIAFFLLFLHLPHNRWSLDATLRRGHRRAPKA